MEKITGQQIKNVLKQNGIDTKKISVKVRSYAVANTSIDVTVKDLNINKNEVEKIVNQFEEIRYDEASYEILQGCNTFVTVTYDYEVLKVEAANMRPYAEEILTKVSTYSNGCGFTFWRNHNDHTLSITKDADYIYLSLHKENRQLEIVRMWNDEYAIETLTRHFAIFNRQPNIKY